MEGGGGGVGGGVGGASALGAAARGIGESVGGGGDGAATVKGPWGQAKPANMPKVDLRIHTQTHAHKHTHTQTHTHTQHKQTHMRERARAHTHTHTQKVDLRRLVHEGLVRANDVITCKTKNGRITADGDIEYSGKKLNSPSSFAHACGVTQAQILQRPIYC